MREGLAAGLTQVVLLGAGFDARGLRMPEIAEAHATVYEIDTAAQLERKRAVLTKAGFALPPSIEHVACEFEQTDLEGLTAALEARGFRRGRGALFVWEGVIGYIGRETIDRSLAFMAQAGGPGSRLCFTFGQDSFHPDTAAQGTRRMGFSTCEELGFDEVWRRYLPSEPHPYAFALRIGTALV